MMFLFDIALQSIKLLVIAVILGYLFISVSWEVLRETADRELDNE